MDKNEKTLEPVLAWARELQFLAQAGLEYSKDVFDIERFKRIREISAEMMSLKTGVSLEKVKDVFCNETGFKTPKLDTRAVVFKDNKILLVKESDGRWSLPGGWVDEMETVKSNTVKELYEEAGIKGEAVRVIALHDRNKRNAGIYVHSICKIFVLCRAISGSFKENSETTQSGYFDIDNLPPLAEEKTTKEQIKMCFDAKDDKNFEVEFD